MRTTDFAPGGVAAADTGSEYRIREVEARVDRRVAALESAGRRGRWLARITVGAMVVTLVALGFVLTRVAPSDGVWSVGTVSAQELVLRDSDGVARGSLATDDAGRAQLILADRDGRERIRLTVLADGSPGVTIHDRDARPRALLAYLPDGTTNLVFADEDGVGRAVFGLDADGSAQALFTDRSGAIRTLVGVGTDGAPEVSVFEGSSPGGSRP